MVNWLPNNLVVSVPFSKIKGKVVIEDNVRFLNDDKMQVKFNEVLIDILCHKFKMDKKVITKSRCENTDGNIRFRMYCKHGGIIYMKILTAQFISSFGKADETLWLVEKHNYDDGEQCDDLIREYIAKNKPAPKKANVVNSTKIPEKDLNEAVASSSTNIQEELGILKTCAQQIAEKASKVQEEASKVQEEASIMEGKIKALEAKLAKESESLSKTHEDESQLLSPIASDDDDDDEIVEDDEDGLDVVVVNRLAKALDNLEKARRAYEIERVRAENEKKQK